MSVNDEPDANLGGSAADRSLGGGTTESTGGNNTVSAPSTGGQAMGGAAGNDDMTETIPVDWWNADFRSRVRVDINNTGLGSSLTDFPIALGLEGEAYEPDKAGTAGDALRFVDEDQETELPYEIEWGATLADSTIWIRVPEIADASTSDSVWLYYDNEDAGPGEQPPLVWSNGFLAVYHLNGDVEDSTSFMHDGAPNGVLPASGQSQEGYEFGGSGQFISLGTPADLTNIFEGGATLSAWINPQGYGNSTFPRLFDKSNDTTGGSGWALQIHNGGPVGDRLHFEHGFSTQYGQWQTDEDQVTVPGWQSISVSYDSTDMLVAPRMFINASELTVNETETPDGTLPDDAPLPLYVGERSGQTDRSFDGVMDEVRISGVMRSADWIELEHRCMAGGCASLSNTAESLD